MPIISCGNGTAYMRIPDPGYLSFVSYTHRNDARVKLPYRFEITSGNDETPAVAWMSEDEGAAFIHWLRLISVNVAVSDK